MVEVNSLIKNVLFLLITAFFLSSGGEVFAYDLSGYCYLGGVYINSNESSKDQINSLDKDNETEEEFSPAVYFQVYLKEKDGVSGWFIQNKDLDALDFGRSQQAHIGVFHIKAFWALPESVWKDPFAVDENPNDNIQVDRESTQLRKYGGAISYELPGALTVDYSYTSIRIDRDKTTTYKDLGREGYENQISLSFPINEWIFGGHFSMLDAKGRADSSKGFGGSISHTKVFSDSFIMQLSAKVINSVFEKEHPLFDQTREDIDVQFQSMLKARMSGSLFCICFIEYEETYSNIDFFDESEMTFAVGIGKDF